MYKSGKIILGLIVFILLASTPFWMNLLGTGTVEVPDLKYPEGETMCIEDKDHMRAYHMDILNKWRDLVVRENKRYVDINGTQVEMSLSKSCMSCHSNKEEFCDRCHGYLGVKPYCWDCHVEPKEVKP